MIIKNTPPLCTDIGKQVYTENYGICILKGYTEDGKFQVALPNFQGTVTVDYAYYVNYSSL